MNHAKYSGDYRVHISTTDQDMFTAGLLGEEESARIRDHMDQCAVCAWVVSATQAALHDESSLFLSVYADGIRHWLIPHAARDGLFAVAREQGVDTLEALLVAQELILAQGPDVVRFLPSHELEDLPERKIAAAVEDAPQPDEARRELDGLIPEGEFVVAERVLALNVYTDGQSGAIVVELERRAD